MNSVVNPASSYGFGSSQASALTNLSRGYSPGSQMAQRPSFAIQELLGLSGTQYGAVASQAAAAQGFTPSQFFSAAAANNDPSGAGVSPGMGSAYPYPTHPAHHHPAQNFSANATASMVATSMAQGGDVHDFSSGMSSMYSPAWRGHPHGFLSGFSREDGSQGRGHQHAGGLHGGGVDHLGSVAEKHHHLGQPQGKIFPSFRKPLKFESKHMK